MKRSLSIALFGAILPGAILFGAGAASAAPLTTSLFSIQDDVIACVKKP